MNKLAIVIGSKTGHTAKVADRLADRLRPNYELIEIINVLDESRLLEKDFRTFDRYLVGAPLYCGEYPEQVVDWLTIYRDLLETKGFSFFSIGLVDASFHPMNRLFQSLRLKPTQMATFHGSVCHQHWGWIQSLVLRFYSRNIGLTFARDRDYDLTNWALVDAFAESLVQAEVLPAGPHTPQCVSPKQAA